MTRREQILKLCDWYKEETSAEHIRRLDNIISLLLDEIERLEAGLRGEHAGCNYLAYGFCNKCGTHVNIEALTASPLDEILNNNKGELND